MSGGQPAAEASEPRPETTLASDFLSPLMQFTVNFRLSWMRKKP